MANNITKKQFSDRMMIMNSVTTLGFGIVYPIIGRAYQENLILFWLTLQTFATFGCGWLINKALETPNIKQIVFKSVPIAFTIAVVLDSISIVVFIITHNYLIVLLIDIVCSTTLMCTNDAFNEIVNCMFEKSELSDFHRRERKYGYGMNAVTEALVMLIAGVFIKDKEISVNTMILSQCVMLVAEILTDYGYYKLLYIPCKEKVFDMWKTENK